MSSAFMPSWATPEQTRHQRHDEQHQENEKQNLRDFRSAYGMPVNPKTAAMIATTKNTSA